MADTGFARCLREGRAQGTVEYAITVVAVLALVIACAAFWRAAEDGTFARLAQQASSHAMDAAGAVDISLF